MERRDIDRRLRRLRVHFWRLGSDQQIAGFTTNISANGMFIATHKPLPPGTRLRVEIASQEQSGVFEAVAVHAHRAPPAMQAVSQSGMGVRFLDIRELVGELMPEVGSTPDEKRGPRPPDGVYPVRFGSAGQLAKALERDLQSGGLFVPSAAPAALHSEITVEIMVDDEIEPLRFRARVVHCIDAETPTGDGNLLAGMGVELLDPEGARCRVEAYLDHLKS